MKRFFWFLTLLPLFGQYAQAQTITDALRFSQINVSGTARSLGAGNAMGALGADFSVLSINPAGLATYRKSEFTFTPALSFANTDALLRGTGNSTLNDQRSKFGFSNVGVVFSTEPNNARWKTFNVGIGLNKTAAFNNAIYYKGNGAGTIMNGFYNEVANEIGNGGSINNLYPFGSKLAFDANAIYLQDDVLTYDFAGYENTEIARSQSILTSGGMQEMVLSFGGNFDEKLMVGATIGVPFVNYTLEGSYEEEDPQDAVPYFDKLRYNESLHTNGFGANLKVGVQYKINPIFRLGAAFHTPTFMGLTESYSNTFQYTYTDGTGTNQGDPVYSPDGTNDYRLRTPWRAIFSGGAVIKKYGFLSADVELVDYTASRFNLTADVASNDNQDYERELNNQLHRAYRQAVNFRLGGEAAINKFRLRAGVNMLGNPNDGQSDYTVGYTAGVGVRGDRYYIDLGYRRGSNSNTILPYSDADNQPIADATTLRNDFLMTVGFKF